MLGPVFSYKCLLSPALKIDLFRTYTSHIIQSGLSSFSLTPNMIGPLAVFQRKFLKGIMNLSKGSIQIRKCPKKWKRPPTLPQDVLDFYEFGKIGNLMTPPSDLIWQKLKLRKF